ncbi:Vacuolar protein sorting associated protein 35 [Trichuris trichiura]|uniref:Vacuolar protein sorting-associated protein 35 n=1 Tax=Trichuris trichiura TaxID=36087 RepID=A0A077ZCT5_TRITR|nr:Vacuolar protein sorting associated protein 35 [Trichuris trichiura]
MVREEGQETVDQKKLLDDSLHQVKLEAAEMRHCLEKSLLLDALKHASQMLAELRTSALTPKYYYHLYMEITHELQRLELALIDEFQKGNRRPDLYEIVQYASNIIPRLYLLITVGIAFIKLHEASRRDILRDLVEMCCGVQHPLRGLFLRHYLLQCTQNLLPKSVNEEHVRLGTHFEKKTEDGTVHDSVDFILANFGEMNKLWVRMQHQGQSRDRERRERERRELQILVGTNLVRLSQLDNISIDYYKKCILPKILVQVVSCKDPIAQEYLMECVIQVFSDEFHVRSLDVFLKTCADMHQRVNIKNVLTALIDRLISSYGMTEEGREIQENYGLFELLSEQIASIVQSRSEMLSEDIVQLQVSMINFALSCYRTRYQFVDKVFATTYTILQGAIVPKTAYNCPLGKELGKLFRIPIEVYNDVLTLLKLENYGLALSMLDHRGRIKIASCIVMNMLDERTEVNTVEATEKLLALLSVLLTDQVDQPRDYEKSDEFVEEQTLVSRMVHLLRSDDPHNFFNKGGRCRLMYTYVPLIFKAFVLSREYYNNRDEDVAWEEKAKAIFQFIHQTICSLLNETESASLPFRLFLQSALVIDTIPIENREMLAYEFLSQAFAVYEEEISDSRAQLAAIILITGTLQKTSCFSEENHEPLRTQCLLSAGKLFKKPDQCRAVISCAHLFWSGQIAGQSDRMRQSKRVVECLKKGLKIASQCVDPYVQVQLFIEVLNHYICFSEDGCPDITRDMINELIAKVSEALARLEMSSDVEQIQKHFNNTVEHLKVKKAETESTAATIASLSQAEI